MLSVEQLTPAEWCTLLFADAAGWLSLLVNDDGIMRAKWAEKPAGAGYVAEHATGDVWLGCSTRAEMLPKGRGGDDDCLEVPGLWLDIDVADGHHKTKLTLPPDRAAARDLLNDFPLKSTAVIDSGGGIQAWWLFPTPLPAADVAEILPAWTFTWQEFGRRRGWHVDNVFDLARVMRIPGTFNHKTDPPKPVRLVHLTPARRYNLDDLDGYTLVPPTISQPPEPAEPAAVDGAAADRGMLTESAPGASPRAGDRFNAAADLGALLRDAGCVHDHTDRDGTEHYRAPHHAGDHTTGIVVYPADASGSEHATVFSETFAAQHGLEPRRPYDAFGLFTHLQHQGDFRAARTAIAGEWVDVPTDVMDLVTPSEPAAAPRSAAPDPWQENETERDDEVTVPGDVFVWQERTEIQSRWGEGHNVLWASGESLMIVGPPGVGKTTVGTQIVAGLLGLREKVLGLPVAPAKRVLYLALDRPNQIRRAMGRLFDPADAEILHERLLVRRGPLLTDLAKNPMTLLEQAKRFDCDVVFIDSLKDAAIKLTDDETGGMVNRAIQWCNAEGVDVCSLHHQRKGEQGTKPNTLSDVYGSAWLTAGTGSVILLWGDAGDEDVLLVHLKQPIDPVGPLELHHDHDRGVTTVVHSFDTLGWLRRQGAAGGTALEAAKAEHHDATLTPKSKQTKTARSRLDKLVNRGFARRLSGPAGGGQFGTVQYAAIGQFDLDDLLPEPASDHADLPGGNDRSVRSTHRSAASEESTVPTTVPAPFPDDDFFA